MTFSFFFLFVLCVYLLPRKRTSHLLALLLINTPAAKCLSTLKKKNGMHRLSFRKSMCRNNKKKKATVRAYQVKKHPYLPFLFSGLASTFRFYRLPRFPARLASESDFLIFFFSLFLRFFFFVFTNVGHKNRANVFLSLLKTRTNKAA